MQNKEIYDRILQDERWLGWMAAIDKHAEEITREEYLYDHSEGHAHAVADRAMDFIWKLRMSDEEVWLAGIAGLLHDIGNAVNRDDHEKESARMLEEDGRNFLRSVGMKDEGSMDRLIYAVSAHSSGNEINDVLDAAVVLADKIDQRKSRMLVSEEAAMEYFDEMDRAGRGYSEAIKTMFINVMKVNDVSIEIWDDRLVVKYAVDEGFGMGLFHAWPKAVRVPFRVAQFLGKGFELSINGVTVPEEEYRELL